MAEHTLQAHISKAHWDSSTFNLAIGDVFIENPEKLSSDSAIELIKWVISMGKKEQYQLLYLKLPFSLQLTELSLHCKEIILADTKTIYKKRIRERDSQTHNTHVVSYAASEADEVLLNLSFESGKYSRFKLDHNFPSGTFEKMYSIWINKTVSKETSESVLVYQDKDKILGMVTYTIQPTSALIGLIAVDKSHQGRNIGSILLSVLEQIVHSNGISIIEVATQKKNLAACRFYQKNKFDIEKETNIYHIWL